MCTNVVGLLTGTYKGGNVVSLKASGTTFSCIGSWETVLFAYRDAVRRRLSNPTQLLILSTSWVIDVTFINTGPQFNAQTAGQLVMTQAMAADLKSAGVMWVTAAGNDPNVNTQSLCPACFAAIDDQHLILGVGSVNHDNSVSPFSTPSPTSGSDGIIGIYAYGNLCLQALYMIDDSYIGKFGTSISTALVAGLAAQLFMDPAFNIPTGTALSQMPFLIKDVLRSDGFANRATAGNTGAPIASPGLGIHCFRGNTPTNPSVKVPPIPTQDQIINKAALNFPIQTQIIVDLNGNVALTTWESLATCPQTP
ncbi:hypothetical protein F5884DRAFT_805791 [Xylogone sp. PMI_703]|nr:hypothetical protein F5884DRAFT_805791 [Xylogone sp. PMI_703]